MALEMRDGRLARVAALAVARAIATVGLDEDRIAGRVGPVIALGQRQPPLQQLVGGGLEAHSAVARASLPITMQPSVGARC